MSTVTPVVYDENQDPQISGTVSTPNAKEAKNIDCSPSKTASASKRTPAWQDANQQQKFESQGFLKKGVALTNIVLNEGQEDCEGCAQWNQKFQPLQIQLANAQQEVKEYKARYDKIQHEGMRLLKVYEENATKLRDTKAQNNDLAESVEALTKENEMVKAEYNRIYEAYQELADAYKKMEQVAEQFEKERNFNQEQLSEMQQRLSQSQEEVNKAKLALAAKERQMEEAKSQAQSRVSPSTQLITDAFVAVSEQEQMYVDLIANLNAQVAEMTLKMEQMQTAEPEADKTTASVVDASEQDSRVETLLSSNKLLQEENVAITSQLEKKCQEILALEEELATMTAIMESNSKAAGEQEALAAAKKMHEMQSQKLADQYEVKLQSSQEETLRLQEEIHSMQAAHQKTVDELNEQREKESLDSNELQEKCQELSSLLEKAEACNSELTVRIEQMKMQRQHSLLNLVRRHVSSFAANSLIGKELSAAKRAKSALLQERDELFIKCEDSQADIERFKAELDAIRREKDEMTEFNAEERMINADIVKDLEASVSEIRQELQAKVEEIHTLSTQLKERDVAKEQKDRELSEMKASKQELSDQLTEAKLVISDNQEAIAKLERTVEEGNQAKEQLNENLGVIIGNETSLIAEVSRLNSEYESLKKKAAHFEAEANQAKESLKQVTSQLLQAQSQLQLALKHNETTGEEVAHLKKQERAAKEQAHEQDKNIQELKAEVDVLRLTEQCLKKQCQELRDALVQSKEAVAQKDTAMTRIERQLAQSQSTVARITKELCESNDLQNTYRQHAAKAEGRADALEEQVHSLKTSLESQALSHSQEQAKMAPLLEAAQGADDKMKEFTAMVEVLAKENEHLKVRIEDCMQYEEQAGKSEHYKKKTIDLKKEVKNLKKDKMVAAQVQEALRQNIMLYQQKVEERQQLTDKTLQDQANQLQLMDKKLQHTHLVLSRYTSLFEHELELQGLVESLGSLCGECSEINLSMSVADATSHTENKELEDNLSEISRLVDEVVPEGNVGEEEGEGTDSAQEAGDEKPETSDEQQ